MKQRVPRQIWAGISVAAVGLALALTSCRKHAAPPAPAPAREDVVAQIGDRVITAAQWQGALERMGTGASSGQKEQVLEDLVRREVLLVQARNAGYDRKPELQARYDQLVSAQFAEDRLKPLLRDAGAVSEAEIAAYYEAHSTNYFTPEALRLGVIWLRLGVKTTPEKRAEAVERALAILARARETNDAGFARLAELHSEDQSTRYRSGDAGWLARAGAAAGGHWPEPVLEAGRALAVPGEMAPLVETSNGLYIVRLLERRDASRRPLAEVRDGIRYLAARAKQQEAEKRFYEQLSAEVPIRINRQLLDSISIPSNTVSAVPPPMPGG